MFKTSQLALRSQQAGRAGLKSTSARSWRTIHQDSSKRSSQPAVAYDDACVPLKSDQVTQAQPKGFATGPTAEKLLELDQFTDEEIVDFIDDGKVPLHHLEYRMKDLSRAVRIRRSIVLGSEAEWSSLPYEDYNWEAVRGANAENVIGYATIPIGVVNNLVVNGTPYRVPLSTTEGCLIASTQRGAKAIMLSGGVEAAITKRAMTRAPVVKFPSALQAARFLAWIESPENYRIVEEAFNSTTRFGRLESIKTKLVGRNAYIRFCCNSGDAMGMNMVSKGSEKAMKVLQEYFPEMDLISIAGNFCTDKKASAINWIDGRGRSVVADIVLHADVVKSVLKTTVDAIVDLNISKNMLGSALAGSIGGFNAHAANLVAAVFLACGQDPAQVIESSSCITHMEKTPEGDLYMSVTMPSIEVGTVGGGTSLPTQAACLDMLGIRGASPETPGTHGDVLAQVIAGTVLAGELSLLGAQAAGHLVESHMRLNRKPATE